MLIIAGDSWACGEWGVGSHQILDQSITNFFLNHGIEVFNIAHPGGSLSSIWERIRDCLRQNDQSKISAVLIFQTDFTRESWFWHPTWNHSFFESKKRVLDTWYRNLNSLAIEYQIKIFIVGGIGEVVCDKLVKFNYANLITACQSITNLVLHDDDKVTIPITSNWDSSTERIVNSMKKTCSQEELDMMLLEIDLAHQRQQKWSDRTEWFFPDGMHPNRYAHAKLGEYILPIIEKEIA